MSSRPTARGLLSAVVLACVCASAFVVAPAAGAAQPEQGGAEVTTPMVEVADRRDSDRLATSVVLLLGANAAMLAVGAGMLWRRCSERQAARQL